ncbi:MAG: glycoside hydrolase family 9 protein [Vicinamibacteraceae bacterium]|nr:glycoside hydrolase family 9 protein [Vicinamibacteraceae bacterium]
MSSGRLFVLLGLVTAGAALAAQSPREPQPVAWEHSAEAAWLRKPVLESRTLDDMTDPATWAVRGDATHRFEPPDGPVPFRRLRIEMDLSVRKPAAGVAGLPSVTATRGVDGEDWTRFNRLSLWIRPQMSGFHILPIVISLRNDGAEKVPDVYNREGNHYVTLTNGQWTHIVWEITPLARDKVTAVGLHYWANKRLPGPGDRIAFDVAGLELQRVEADHFEGWNVAPGRLAFSHTGYRSTARKTALATGLEADRFEVVRLETGERVFAGPVERVTTPRGEFQRLDFSAVRAEGRYTVRAGPIDTRPFRIARDVWDPTIWKTLNFFYGERCGTTIPGLHDACHRDWLATHGDLRIVMNGGWHDAGDLSQGLINTGEATYVMFALAERLAREGRDPALVARLIEEARWGLDWVLKVRFKGGYRIGFASMNTWTNGIIGDEDDRPREALKNPNVNYIAAAAGARAARVLRTSDPALAARALAMARQDWLDAIDTPETPENLSTPAFASTDMELASVGILASLELYAATGDEHYSRKARELAPIVLDSQQRAPVGTRWPLGGFFYTGPDRTTLFHQFHRGNDQAPIVAMAALCEAFPDDPDWIRWYALLARYAEYQKAAAEATAPYGVLPAYVYRERDFVNVPEEGDRYQASREAYREQVVQGTPLGDGYYLKAFPVWFARRGNYGVLLSQAKALATAARLRRDAAAADLVQRQLEWVVGRNPFSQSTMWGEGYDFAQQYSVSSGDIVGSLPVGMMTRKNADAPYWPSQNGYVYKEVWVHPSVRWLWILEDGEAFAPGDGNGGVRARRRTPDISLAATPAAGGRITIAMTARGTGRHRVELRADNLEMPTPARDVDLTGGGSATVMWQGRVRTAGEPWVAVAIVDGDVEQRVELYGPVTP